MAKPLPPPEINNIRNYTNDTEVQKSFVSIQDLTQNYVNYDLVEESMIENLKNNDNPASILLKHFKKEWNSDIKKVIQYTRQ